MEHFFIISGILLIGLISLSLTRAILGPTVIDRLVGINVIGTKTTVLIVLTGVIFNRVDMFIDIAIAYAMLNFIVSIAASKYFYRYKAIHHKPDDIKK